MARVLLGDFRTGGGLVDVPFLEESWERRVNTPESITAKFTLSDPDIQDLNLRSAATTGKAFIAVVEGTEIMAAGPVWRREYDQDEDTLQLTGAGIWSWANRRTISRTAAASADPGSFVVPDPANPGQTIPNPVLAWAVSGLSLGTIVKRLLQQAEAWPAGGVPLVYPDDILGDHVRTYDGIDFKSIGEAISDLTQVDGGPDVEFRPRWRADRLGIEWVLATGTDASPRLGGLGVHRWDLSVEESSARGLHVVEDASDLSSIAWVTGGRADDTAIVARASSTALTDAGYPLLETVDSSHTSVSEPATLQLYATEIVRTNSTPSELWSFEVKKDQAPRIGEYGLGDTVRLEIADDHYLPDSPPGGYRRTITGISGDEGNWVTITTAETHGDG